MYNRTMSTTKQVPNPTGKGGFADNPQNRSNGSWKKSDTPRYKLEQMMKLSEDELIAVAKDKDAPYFERKLANAINKADWKVIKEMTDQVYGQPKQTIDTTIAIPQPLAPVRKQDLDETN